MKAAQKDRALYLAIASKMPPDTAPMDLNTAHALRRAQLTLHRWAEEMCNGTIQRDGMDANGQPYRHYGNGTKGPFLTVKCPDRERGALARIEKVCKAADLHYYHQTDPRGCALYVSAEPLTDQNYSSRGVPCL